MERDDYLTFLESKSQAGADSGFAPLWLPDCLFDFQRELVDWAVRKGPSYYRQAVKNVQMAASGRKDFETSEAFDFESVAAEEDMA